jgi:Uncharacterised nucleotidyltransferase
MSSLQVTSVRPGRFSAEFRAESKGIGGRVLAGASLEHQVIFDCIRSAFDRGTGGRDADVNWDQVMSLASRYGLVPLVRAGLAAQGLVVPEHVRRGLELGRAMVSLHLKHEVEPALRCTLGALKTAGLEPLVLKGAALAYQAYAEPVHRTFADVDLLLPADRIGLASHALLEHGFWIDETKQLRPTHQHGKVHYDREKRIPIELHHHLLDAGSPYTLSIDDCLRRSRLQLIAGVEARVLAPTDSLLHVCVHLSYGHAYEWFPLRALTDVLALTTSGEDLDWDLFLKTVRSSRTDGAVHWPLRFSRHWLGAPIPDEVLTALAPPAPLRKAIAAIAEPAYILDQRPPAKRGSDVLSCLLLNLSLYSGCSVRRQASAVLASLFPEVDAIGHLPAEVTRSRLRYAGHLAGFGRIMRGVLALGGLLSRLREGETVAAPVCRRRVDCQHDRSGSQGDPSGQPA